MRISKCVTNRERRVYHRPSSLRFKVTILTADRSMHARRTQHNRQLEANIFMCGARRYDATKQYAANLHWSQIVPSMDERTFIDLHHHILIHIYYILPCRDFIAKKKLVLTNIKKELFLGLTWRAFTNIIKFTDFTKYRLNTIKKNFKLYYC